VSLSQTASLLDALSLGRYLFLDAELTAAIQTESHIPVWSGRPIRRNFAQTQLLDRSRVPFCPSARQKFNQVAWRTLPTNFLRHRPGSPSNVSCYPIYTTVAPMIANGCRLLGFRNSQDIPERLRFSRPKSFC
jgi:hypothetical protein